MTKPALTVGEDQSMAAAHKLMREHHIRHLPVLRGGEVVGIVSDADLHLVEAIRDVHPEKVRVGEAMTVEPYCVTPETALDEVVSVMAEKKLSSVVVMHERKVAGIFTVVDACRAFAEHLRG